VRLNFAICLGTAVLAMVAIGCGGGDSTGGTTATMSKHQFLKKANLACEEAINEQTAAFQRLVSKAESEASPNGAQVRDEAADRMLAIASSLIDKLEALGLPEGEEDKAEALLAEYREGLSRAEAKPASFFTGKAFGKADDAAEAYGLTRCGL
jgi:hypothetical protein